MWSQMHNQLSVLLLFQFRWEKTPLESNSWSEGMLDETVQESAAHKHALLPVSAAEMLSLM